MRIIIALLFFISLAFAIRFEVTPSNARNVNGGGGVGGRINPVVIPPSSPKNSYQKQEDLGVKIIPKREQTRYAPDPLDVKIQRPKNYSKPSMQKPAVRVVPPRNYVQNSYGEKPNIKVVPPVYQNGNTQKNSNLHIKIYPPLAGNSVKEKQNIIKPYIGDSKPITQEMMFYQAKPYRMKLPPKKQRIAQMQTPPKISTVQDEYEGEDEEPLFIRNRNGVMIGAGIGGSFDRLWVGGSGGNKSFYDSAFTYYFRLGYQYYFTDYLGVRAYVHLGDWSNIFSQSFFDGQREVPIDAALNFNYSIFFEVLYDFVVLQNHSFGIFGGFGIGASYGEFSNDGVEKIEEYFAMPAFSVGFAYTLFENNRFEFEFKVPLREEVLENSWRSKLSTWMLGVSYTYIF